MFWKILIVIIVLIIHGAIASTFSDYAEAKGYDKSPYFWACFLLGVAGYCMVAALPDLELYSRLNEISSNTVPAPTHITPSATATIPTSTATVTENKTWICGKCNTENSINYGQCKKCGTFRS